MEFAGLGKEELDGGESKALQESERGGRSLRAQWIARWSE